MRRWPRQRNRWTAGRWRIGHRIAIAPAPQPALPRAPHRLRHGLARCGLWTVAVVVGAGVGAGIGAGVGAGGCWADSALTLISGFDERRIDAAYPPDTEESLAELSKLLYRLRGIDRGILASRASPQYTRLGDVISIDGVIQRIRVLRVPSRLVEFLEFDRLEVLELAGDTGIAQIISTGLSESAAVGDRVDGVAVLIELGKPSDGDPAPDGLKPVPVAAAAELRWYPQSTSNSGWTLLSGAGFDAGLLKSVAARNKLPLSADDGDAFYAMMAAAQTIGRDPGTPAPPPVDPIELLTSPRRYVGRWMRVPLETVQVTRVEVTEPRRREQLGSDHYYQIDSFGSLGNVVARIERAPGDQRPAAVFENRYPVSVVALELPEAIRRAMHQRAGATARIAEVRLPVECDAFFFRLWSYSTDYMNQFGGGEQFGPLLVAAEIRPRRLPDDPVGVGRISSIAAIAVAAAILAIWLWNRRLAREDRRVRQQRSRREAENVTLPDR